MTFQAPSRSAMIWALQELELEGHSENLILNRTSLHIPGAFKTKMMRWTLQELNT